MTYVSKLVETTRDLVQVQLEMRQARKEIERLREDAERSRSEVFRLVELLRKADPAWGAPMHTNAARKP
jgi:hypothetical protein